MDPGHVIGRRTRVLGGDVAAPQPGHEAAVVTVDRPSHVGVAVVDVRAPCDHPLATPPPQPRQGVLVPHPLAEAQPIAHQIRDSRVAPEPYAAGGLTAARLVYERGEQVPALLADLEEDPLVPVEVPPVLGDGSAQRIQDIVADPQLRGIGIRDQERNRVEVRCRDVDGVAEVDFDRIVEKQLAVVRRLRAQDEEVATRRFCSREAGVGGIGAAAPATTQ